MTLTVTEKESGKTIRELLRKDMGYSSGMLKKLKFTEGGITVNGGFVTVRYELKEGDVLRLADEDRPEDTCPYMIPVDLPLKIVYEDADVTAVDKPPAMPAHPSHGHRLDTVANALAYRYRGAPYVFRPVNRLDCDTSGLMLTANTRLAASLMYRSMVAGDIVKMYLAVLSKAPKTTEGAIDLPMGRCDDSIIKRRIYSPEEPGAKSALTLYTVLYTDSQSGRCAVLAAPVTGRTHQIRLHFAAVGCPLCGDSLYDSPDMAIGRQALHAAYLSFPHPAKKERITLTSPLPEDIASLLSAPHEAAARFETAAERTLEKLKLIKQQNPVPSNDNFR